MYTHIHSQVRVYVCNLTIFILPKQCCWNPKKVCVPKKKKHGWGCETKTVENVEEVCFSLSLSLSFSFAPLSLSLRIITSCCASFVTVSISVPVCVGVCRSCSCVCVSNSSVSLCVCCCLCTHTRQEPSDVKSDVGYDSLVPIVT